MLTTPKSISLHVNGRPIEHVESVKYLGVTIDRHLKWTEHLDSIITKFVMIQIQPLPQHINNTLMPYAPTSTIVTVYGSQIKALRNPWRGFRSFIRMATRDSTTDYSTLLRSLNLEPLASRIRYHIAIQVFKAVSDLSPPYLRHVFEYSSERTLRNKSRL